MDKDKLMETLKELFSENRISFDFSKFNDYSGKGLELEIKLDKQIVYSERVYQHYYES